jgi:hypothetical protein
MEASAAPVPLSHHFFGLLGLSSGLEGTFQGQEDLSETKGQCPVSDLPCFPT